MGFWSSFTRKHASEDLAVVSLERRTSQHDAHVFRSRSSAVVASMENFFIELADANFTEMTEPGKAVLGGESFSAHLFDITLRVVVIPIYELKLEVIGDTLGECGLSRP